MASLVKTEEFWPQFETALRQSHSEKDPDPEAKTAETTLGLLINRYSSEKLAPSVSKKAASLPSTTHLNWPRTLFDAMGGPHNELAAPAKAKSFTVELPPSVSMSAQMKNAVIPGALGHPDISMPLRSIPEAMEFDQLASKYKPVHTEEGIRLKLPGPNEAVYVTVDSPENALALMRLHAASNEALFESHIHYTLEEPAPLTNPGEVSFGLEAELFIQESPDIVEDYRLGGFSEAAWLKMPPYERVNRVRIEVARFNLEKSTPLMFRLSSAPKQLPEQLFTDTSLTLEMRGMIFPSIERTRAFVDFIFQRYGPASLQGHVVRRGFRGRDSAGYTVFEADRSQIKTLEQGYTRFLADSSDIPAKNLIHRRLRPMTDADRRAAKWREFRAAIGLPATLDRDDAHFIYGPVFRSDIYGRGRKGIELRQYHKRAEELLRSMEELGVLASRKGGLKPFRPFKNIPLMSKNLADVRGRELRISVPQKKWDDFFEAIFHHFHDYLAVPRLDHFIQNFYFPLRDWKNHPVVQALPEWQKNDVQMRIEQATREFIEQINRLASKQKNRPENEDALSALRIAVARWAHQTQLSQYFERYKRRNVSIASGKNPARLKDLPFVRSITDVAATSDGPPAAMPVLEHTDFAVERFANGTPYFHYRVDPRKIEEDPSYKEFLDSSAEIFITTQLGIPFTQLRIGRRIYGIMHSETPEAFTPSLLHRQRKGFVFLLGKEKIREAEYKAENLFGNKDRFNVPTFDYDGENLEVIPLKNKAGFKYNKPLFSNIKAKLIDENGQYFLQTSEGFKWPVWKKAGRFYTQAFSCASAATYVLKNFLNIKIDLIPGAKSLRRILLKGNPSGRAPDAIIDYK